MGYDYSDALLTRDGEYFFSAIRTMFVATK